MTLMKLRLDFLFTDLSQDFKIYLVVFALKFFIHGHWVRGDVKSFVLQKWESYNHNPNIKPEIFQI